VKPVKAEKPQTASASARTVTLADGAPVTLELAENVPSDIAPGSTLHFVVAQDLKVNNIVAIAKGAAATGTVLERTQRRLLGHSRPMFQFVTVQAVNAVPVHIRATAQVKGNEVPSRVIEANGPKPKDVLAPKGAPFVAFISGDQTVTARQ
jgi:hypothetical protein